MGKASGAKKTAKKGPKSTPRKRSGDIIDGLLADGEVTRDDLLTFLRRMCEIRFFEEKVFDLLGRNIIKGASHLYAGQEAVAVGAIAAIEESDLITSTHRGHGHCHAMGDLHAESPEEKQEHLNKMMAELCGKATGYCRGRGGSMHIADVEEGNLGATGIGQCRGQSLDVVLHRIVLDGR